MKSTILMLSLLLSFCLFCSEEEYIPYSARCLPDYSYNNTKLINQTTKNYFADTACPCAISCADRGDGILYAGASSKIINPSFNNIVSIAGFSHRAALGMSDADIYARALVLKYNETKIALVVLDLVGLFYHYIIEIKQELHPYGFDYVLITSTHNHNGPDTMGLWGPSYVESGLDPEYMQYLHQQVVSATMEADSNKRPANFHYGTTQLTGLTGDYRVPYILDEKLDMLQFTDKETQENIALMMRWGNHPEAVGSSNLYINPDFPYYACRDVENAIGGTALYFSGCVGGLMNPLVIDVPDPHTEEVYSSSSIAKAEALGYYVGQTALELTQTAVLADEYDLAFRAKTFYIPLQNNYLRLASTAGLIDRDSFTHGINKGYYGDELRSEMVIIRIGKAVIVSVPGEMFPEQGYGGISEPYGIYPDAEPEPSIAAAVQEYDFFTIVGLANDELGYIIPKKQYNPDFYEETFCVGPETASQVSSTAYTLAQELP